MVAISGTSEPASARRVTAELRISWNVRSSGMSAFVHALPQLARKPSSVHAVLFVVVRITVTTRVVQSSVALSGLPAGIFLTMPSCVPRDAGTFDDALGPSQWLVVEGEATSKWCPDEGRIVVTLLKEIADSRIDDPDLDIITPFRVVAKKLRDQLKRETQLCLSLRVDAQNWVKNRIGTIHTFQGREAHTVLVLGALNASQRGARKWAADTPNILNVAVSRARQNLYVIGSHGAWSGVGHARDLASALPLRRPRTNYQPTGSRLQRKQSK
jgi:hypothetical protein